MSDCVQIFLYDILQLFHIRRAFNKNISSVTINVKALFHPLFLGTSNTIQNFCRFYNVGNNQRANHHRNTHDIKIA